MKQFHAFAATAALLLLASAAAAAPVRRVNEIRAPLLSAPAIARAGATFTIRLKLPEGATPAEASLYGIDDPAVRVPLALSPAGEKDGLAVFTAAVPPGTPEALYDLAVRWGDTSWDYQPHAVKIVREFKSRFDFVHITDIHFNTQDVPGKDMNRIRRRLLQDLSRLNPEFVLLSGDLCMDPENYDRDYTFAYDEPKRWLRAPVFIVPGNHELYTATVNGVEIDGLDYWTAAFGPAWNSFDYGPLHVLGINSYDWPARWRARRSEEADRSGSLDSAAISAAQMAWIRKDLAAAPRGSTCVAYTHIPVETLQGNRPVGVPPNQVTLDGPSTKKLVTALAAGGCTHLFVGHLHYDTVNRIGGITEVLSRAAGISFRHKGDNWSYRVVHVENGKITGWENHNVSFADIDVK